MAFELKWSENIFVSTEKKGTVPKSIKILVYDFPFSLIRNLKKKKYIVPLEVTLGIIPNGFPAVTSSAMHRLMIFKYVVTEQRHNWALEHSGTQLHTGQHQCLSCCWPGGGTAAGRVVAQLPFFSWPLSPSLHCYATGIVKLNQAIKPFVINQSSFT